MHADSCSFAHYWGSVNVELPSSGAWKRRIQTNILFNGLKTREVGRH